MVGFVFDERERQRWAFVQFGTEDPHLCENGGS